MRSLTLLTLALLLGGAAITLPSLTTAPSAPTTGGAPAGQVLNVASLPVEGARRTHLTTRSLRSATLLYSVLGELRSTPGQGTPTRVGVAGTVALGLVAEGEAGVSVEADLSGLQIVSVHESGAPRPIDAEFLSAVRSPARMRWTSGQDTQVFAGAGKQEVASVQRAVLDALAGGFAGGQRIAGEDAFGAYEAENVVSPDVARSERSKMAYRAVEGRGHHIGERTPHGVARYALDPVEGWPRQVDVDESCDIGGDLGAGTYAVVLQATLCSVGAPPQASIAAAPAIDRLIEGLASLLAARGLGADETRQAWERLIAALDRDPALTDTILARLPLCEDGTLANLLCSALGATGHEKAHVALVRIVADAHLPPNVREGAAVAMVQIQAPSDATLAALRADAEREVGEWNGPGGARLLAWGTLAGRAVDPGVKVAELLALAPRARALGAEAFWLEALGNTAHPQARAAIQAQLDAADPLVRFSAASAVRSYRDAETSGRIAHRLSVEPESEVRRQLTASLSGRDAEAAGPGLEVALRDPAESVRRQAIMVASRLSPARALAFLARAAQGDASAELRELAAGLQAGLAGRG